MKAAETDGPRHLLSLLDLSAAEIRGLLALGQSMADGAGPTRPLAGRTLGMLFTKASTRTRVSFEVGMYQLGGHPLMLSARDTQIGRGEGVRDTATVLGRYVDGLMIRTFEQAEVEEYAAHAGVPVINGLTDRVHPCQLLADLLTCRQVFGAEALAGMRVVYVGDGNNMARSWLHASTRLGFELVLCSPEGYRLGNLEVHRARNAGARVVEEDDPKAAAAGCRVVTTDTWISMGQEDRKAARQVAFAGYTVDDGVMQAAADDAIFLHCLPAYRGYEVVESVIDGPQSRIYDEAENRLHAQKAVLAWLMGGVELPT